MGLLAAIIAPQVLKYLDTARTQTAKVQIQNIVSRPGPLTSWDVGRYPTAGGGPQRRNRGPTYRRRLEWSLPSEIGAALTDPCVQPYLYRNPGKHGEIDVYTLGSDKAEGGSGEAADVGDW